MNRQPDRRQARSKRHIRVRTRIRGTSQRPRLAVFRSLHHVYAQLIDDEMGRTLAAAASTDTDLRPSLRSPSGSQAAAAVGKRIAERAREHGLESVVFDRGGFPYHGRVKAMAEAARQAGLKF